jgi:DNA-binding transcriptional LysR family regulator
MNLSGVNTNLLVSLNALLREQNVSRAAEAVGLTQSSMSHALAQLRAHFGDRLLVPSGRRMVLTERGKALVEPVGLAVAHVARVFDRESGFDPSTSHRTFSIVATDNIELFLLPKLMATLHREAPHVDLRVHHLPMDWMKALMSGDVDLKLGRQYRIPPSFRSEELFEERFTCVVRRDHPLRPARPTLRQLADLSYVDVVPTGAAGVDTRGLVDDLLAQQGLQRRVALTVTHFLVAPHVVASSDLALVASERVIGPYVALLRLRALQLPVHVPGYRLTQVWAQRSDDDDGHRWLRRALARVSRDSPVSGP